MDKLKSTVFVTVLAAMSASVGAEESHNVISTADIEWGLLNPLRGDASPRAADLWGDRTKDMATGMLVKFNKGFASPPHIHNITYRGVVIEGLLHNDDPYAAKMWMGPGSFWTQPVGENHITAANADKNLIYLEIDSGPYLVKPSDDAFDNGERPINIASNNIVWADAGASAWVQTEGVAVAYLWGNLKEKNGSFVKIPANFDGYIEKNDQALKAVIVKGSATYSWSNGDEKSELTPSSFFSSKASGKHHLKTGEEEVVLYISTEGSYAIN